MQIKRSMKAAVGCLVALLPEGLNAFIPAVTDTPANAVAARAAMDSRYSTTPRTSLFALEPEKGEENQEGLDLDLEDMFTMFDAANKDESFDEAIKKVKPDEKES